MSGLRHSLVIWFRLGGFKWTSPLCETSDFKEPTDCHCCGMADSQQPQSQVNIRRVGLMVCPAVWVLFGDYISHGGCSKFRSWVLKSY